jgi:hypothetical protein
MSLFTCPSRGDVTITSWLPGETLFSLASRHHLVSCNYHASDTCHQLFGHGRLRSCHDFPSGIDFFVASTRGRFGRAEEVIFERTPLPFYLPFNTKEQAVRAIRSMRGDRIGSLRYGLGMLLNHFQGRHALKACELCMKEDIERFCVAYWHRIHQIPGVWRCPLHQRMLMVLSGTDKSASHYSWCLPRRDELIALASPSSSSEDADRIGFLGQLASAAVALTALASDVSLDSERLARVYSARLVSVGLSETNGKLRLPDCIASVLKSSTPLRAIPELSALPATGDEARAYVSRVCSRPVVRMHALQHLFTIVWLFGIWDAFWAAYETDSGDLVGKPGTNLADTSCLDQGAAYRHELAKVMAEEAQGLADPPSV